MKSKIIALVVAASLALGMSFALIACQIIDPGGSKILTITSQNQESNGVRYVNYIVVVKTDVDWNALSSAEKQEIIDAGVNQARAKASEENSSSFNISGVSQVVLDGNGTITSGGEVLFKYDREKQNVVVYSDGVPTETLTAPAAR